MKITVLFKELALKTFKIDNNKVVKIGKKANKIAKILFKARKSKNAIFKILICTNIETIEELIFLIPNAKIVFNSLRQTFIKILIF